MTVLEPGAHPPTDLQTLATPPLFNREVAVSGMSGGVAYVWDPEGTFRDLCNMTMVEIEPVLSSAAQTKESKAT